MNAPDARAALQAALAGTAAERLPDGALRSAAVRAAVARNEPSHAMPAPPELRGADGAIAAALAARQASIALDPGSAERLAAIARAQAGDDPWAVLEAELATLWARHARGEPVREDARALEARAAKARLAHAVIDAAALAALAALEAGDLEGALALARRASRMARTEGLPHEEYLAHLVLARARRHAGRPHLAIRIATALARAAPPAWRPWIAIELALAGALEPARRWIGDALAPVVALLDRAARGDRRGLEDAIAAAWSIDAGAPLARELGEVVRAIDPAREVGPGDLGAFLGGALDAMPLRLAGVAQIPHAGEAHASVRVVARPGEGARRVLSIGLPLASALEIGREQGAKQHRREAALAQLALAGPEGLAKDELFRAIWGFAFAPHLHQGVLDVLLHRVRASLGDAGELVRREHRVVLVLRAPIAVADPRVEVPLDDRVLALVSERGGAARARELAEDLAVPLRTVQAALARLVDEGECLREGEAQNVLYRVEDTTFREPTRA